MLITPYVYTDLQFSKFTFIISLIFIKIRWHGQSRGYYSHSNKRKLQARQDECAFMGEAKTSSSIVSSIVWYSSKFTTYYYNNQSEDLFLSSFFACHYLGRKSWTVSVVNWSSASLSPFVFFCVENPLGRHSGSPASFLSSHANCSQTSAVFLALVLYRKRKCFNILFIQNSFIVISFSSYFLLFWGEGHKTFLRTQTDLCSGSCLNTLCARVTGVHHHDWLSTQVY